MASTYKMFYEHPKFIDIIKRFPENEKQAKLAFQVYLDLAEARGWWDVHVHHCAPLRLLFVSGRARRHEATTLLVPIDVTQEVSAEQLRAFCEHVTLANHAATGITLAICDTDSTTTYFNVSNSLVAPDPPEQTDVNKRKRASLAQHRRDHVTSEVRRYCDERSAGEACTTEQSGADL